jgi:cold shock CspA family protein
MIGTVVHIIRRQIGDFGFIVEDGTDGNDKDARFYFDAHGCLCDPAEVLTIPGARVSYELKLNPGRSNKPFAASIRVLEPNIEKGIITTHRDDAADDRKFGFVTDGWGEGYYFSPYLTENFSELRIGNHVSFEVTRRRGKPAARNLTKIN